MSGEAGNEGNSGSGTSGTGSTKSEDGDAGKGGGNEFKPVTYSTQEELDAAFADRATRAAESAKKEALKGLPEGVALDDAVARYNEWKIAEDAKKGPEAIAREEAQAAQRELARYKNKEAQELLANEVAKTLKIGETPIPASLLRGSTKEEMTAFGQQLISFFGQVQGSGVRSPMYNPLQGSGEGGQQPAVDPLRAYFETGQFA